jgi:hypothetical protein
MFRYTLIENITSETNGALTVACLTNEFFHESLHGLKFEGRENGRGGYEIIAYHHNLKFLMRNGKKYTKVAWILYRAMSQVQYELKSSGMMKDE